MNWHDIVHSKFLDEQALTWMSRGEDGEIRHRATIDRAEIADGYLVIRVFSVIEDRWRALAGGCGIWREHGERAMAGRVFAFELSRLDPPAWDAGGQLQIACYGQRFAVRHRPRPLLCLHPSVAHKKNGATETVGAFREVAARLQ